MSRSRASRVALVVAVALLAAGCQRPHRDPDLGVSRIALNLAFSADELVKPVEPAVIVRLVPAPPEVREPEDVLDYTNPEPFTSLAPCPEIAPGAAPEVAVEFQIKDPPPAGTLERVNDGKIVFTSGTIVLNLPYPPLTTWQVLPLEDEMTPGVEGVTEPTVRIRWQVRRVVAPGFETIDTLRVDGNNLQLLQRDTMVDGVTSTFKPTPPVNLYVSGNEGDTWKSSGVDSESGTAMLVQGAIGQREVVNACGTPVDTYRVSVEEQVVNLQTGETSGSAIGEPNVYNIATQLGGLAVREDIHMTTATRTEAGAPVTVELDYVSTARGVTPTSGGEP